MMVGEPNIPYPMFAARHLGVVRISGELVQQMFLTTSRKDRWYQVSGGIPADAKFIRMDFDHSGGRCDLLMVFEHESFPATRPGDPLYTCYSPQFCCLETTVDEVLELARMKLEQRIAGYRNTGIKASDVIDMMAKLKHATTFSGDGTDEPAIVQG